MTSQTAELKCPGYIDMKGRCDKPVLCGTFCCKSCLVKRDDTRMKGEILIERSRLNPQWYIKFTAEHYLVPEFICTGCEERYDVEQSSVDGGATPVMVTCVGCGPCPLADTHWGVRTPTRYDAYKEWANFAARRIQELESAQKK